MRDEEQRARARRARQALAPATHLRNVAKRRKEVVQRLFVHAGVQVADKQVRADVAFARRVLGAGLGRALARLGHLQQPPVQPRHVQHLRARAGEGAAEVGGPPSCALARRRERRARAPCTRTRRPLRWQTRQTQSPPARPISCPWVWPATPAGPPAKRAPTAAPRTPRGRRRRHRPRRHPARRRNTSRRHYAGAGFRRQPFAQSRAAGTQQSAAAGTESAQRRRLTNLRIFVVDGVREPQTLRAGRARAARARARARH